MRSCRGGSEIAAVVKPYSARATAKTAFPSKRSLRVSIAFARGEVQITAARRSSSTTSQPYAIQPIVTLRKRRGRFPAGRG